MTGPEIHRSADLESLRELPRLTERDRQVLERLVVMVPETAIATASAVLRTHQGDLHDALFPRQRGPHGPAIGALAAALVYLGLAMSAPGQGKILPILSPNDVQVARRLARDRFARLAMPSDVLVDEREGIPDRELVRLLDTFVERAAQRLNRDPRWMRAVVYAEASAFYEMLARVCAEQFQSGGDVASATQQLEWVARTRDLIVDALAPEDTTRTFDPAQREARLARLRSFGWQEFVASSGRTLREIGDEARRAGLHTFTEFALGEEWAAHGASRPTRGGRYFIRPALLPDSTGLAWWAQQERLKPLQKILAGDPVETGLRLGLGSVELFLEFVVRTGQCDFLVGKWTRTANEFDGMFTRFGLLDRETFAVTLFPGARYDDAVGVCPVIEVVDPQ